MEDQLLAQITLSELVLACRRETARFQRDETSDARYCLEIFRRALQFQAHNTNAPAYDDEPAREQLVLIYTDYILAQINRAALPIHLHRDLIHDVWRNFWQAANNGLRFTTLPAALAYLRQVTVSEVIKVRRNSYRRAREESLQALIAQTGDESMLSTAADLFDTHARTRFRERCAEVLSDPVAYRVFWLRYGLGYTPKEIASRLAADSSGDDRPMSARKVSDLLERCFQRLSEDAEIRALLASD